MSDFKFNPDLCVFGVTNFRNQQVRFGIKTDDRRRHMYIIGKTGMGKSTLMENMFLQDMWNGHGCCYMDPHGDTVEKFLKVVPSHRLNDVIYFNPADVEWPIAFNFFDTVEPEYRHLVASGIVSAFKKIWADSWGPRLEYVLRNSIISLLDYPDSTILGVMRILTDKDFRAKVLEKLTDPVVKSFWVNEFAKLQEKSVAEVISPIQNKIGQFLSSSVIRNIVSQPHSSFNLREVMDGKKILLVNLSKGRLGEDSSSLLGAMMINKLQMAAMSRVNIPEKQRADFFLYVDEFQNFATDSFASILSEARKYRLNLIIGHQYIEQLGDVVKAAVFGNVGSICCFRVGAADSEFLEREFLPRFTKDDIINLPKWKAYLRLMIDGVASDAFSADLLPPISVPEDLSVAEKVIKLCRERYCQPRSVVEEKVGRFTFVVENSGPANQNSGEGKKKYQSKALDLPQGALAFSTENLSQQNNHPGFTPAKNEVINQSVTENNFEVVKSVKSDTKIETKNPNPNKNENQNQNEEQESKSILINNSQSQNSQGIPLPNFAQMTPLNKQKTKVKTAVKDLNSKNSRPLFEAECAECHNQTQVPFKPDGIRPIYCSNCLPKLKAEQKQHLISSQMQQVNSLKPISLAQALGGKLPEPIEVSSLEIPDNA